MKLIFPLTLGPTRTGIAGFLRARLVDDHTGIVISIGLPGADGSGLIADGFVEVGTLGNYRWHYDFMPESPETYGVEIIDSRDGTILGQSVVNQKELHSIPQGSVATLIRVLETGSEDPLTGVLVTLKTALGTVIDRQWTDLDGYIQRWSLDPGNYLVSINPSYGHTSISDTALVVVDGMGTTTYHVASFVVVPPSSAGLCSLTDILLDGSLNPVPDYPVIAKPAVKMGPIWTDTALIGGEEREGVSDGSGVVNLQLVRGKPYYITIPLWGLTEYLLTVPDADQGSIRTIIATG